MFFIVEHTQLIIKEIIKNTFLVYIIPICNIWKWYCKDQDQLIPHSLRERDGTTCLHAPKSSFNP